MYHLCVFVCFPGIIMINFYVSVCFVWGGLSLCEIENITVENHALT